jgi:hypothetical protein
MTDIPAHRAGFTARSGETHVIGDDGAAHKVTEAERKALEADSAARAAAAPEAAAADPATLASAPGDGAAATATSPPRRSRASDASTSDA